MDVSIHEASFFFMQPLIAVVFPGGGLRFRADLHDSFVVNTYSGGFLLGKKNNNKSYPTQDSFKRKKNFP